MLDQAGLVLVKLVKWYRHAVYQHSSIQNTTHAGLVSKVISLILRSIWRCQTV